MNIGRYLRAAQIKLELETRPDLALEEEVRATERYRWELKESVLREIGALLIASGRAGNPNKLHTDLLNRERKATTGIGQGIAIPHVRTMNVKSMVMAFARSTSGVEFLALDGKPVHLFLAVVAPPYDDAQYLKFYREMASIFMDPARVRELMDAQDEHEVIKVFRSVA